MNNFLKISALCLAVSGCVSTSYQPISEPVSKPAPATQAAPTVQAAPSTQDVTVFMNEAQIKGAFTAVGVINHFDAGKYQRLTLGDVISVLKDKARQVGANGIIIDKEEPIVSGIFSRGISVTARAIKF